MASMMLWGSPSRIRRSLKVPGSLSSALQMTYLGSPLAFATKRHLVPVGKPAPPRPCRPDFSNSCDHIRGGHLGEGFAQGVVAVVDDVIFDIVRVDQAGALQNDALFGRQGAFAGGQPGDPPGQLASGRLQVGGDPAFIQVFFDQVVDILRCDRAVDDGFRIDDHHWRGILAADIAGHRQSKSRLPGRSIRFLPAASGRLSLRLAPG